MEPEGPSFIVLEILSPVFFSLRAALEEVFERSDVLIIRLHQYRQNGSYGILSDFFLSFHSDCRLSKTV